MNPVRRWDLLLHTVRYLAPAQLIHRGRRLGRQRLAGWLKMTAGQPTPFPARSFQPLFVGLPQVTGNGPWAAALFRSTARAQEVSRGIFTFINHTESFPEPNWIAPGTSHLWRYHLHYFAYLLDLAVWAAADQTGEAYPVFRRLILSWIRYNQVRIGDSWHPFTISERLPNWFEAARFFDREMAADAEFQSAFRSSLTAQARALAVDPELDSRGNHLIKNLRALIWVGLALDGPRPRRWLDWTLDRLALEVAEQIAPDGGHFERVPGYHAAVMKDLLEMAVLLKRNGGPVPEYLTGALRRMGDFWLAIRPWGDRPPLLKDTTRDATPDPRDLLASLALLLDAPEYKVEAHFGLYPLLVWGRPGWEHFQEWPIRRAARPAVLLAASGYGLLRDEGRQDYLIMDVGRPCPDYLPAHAHADLLSYELQVDGNWVVVDSGVYEYTAGPWRDYFRSTSAHNTVEVAGENQSEVWASFRVARRARPGAVRWMENDDHVVIQGEHDGYRRLAVPVRHRRTVLWFKGRFWLFIDELLGRGQTRALEHLHLHPDYLLKATGPGAWAVAAHPGSDEPLMWVRLLGHGAGQPPHDGEELVRQGWYSERFGQKTVQVVLSWPLQGDLPLVTGYLLTRNPAVGANLTLTSGQVRVALTDGPRGYDFRIHPDGAVHIQ